MKEFQPDFTALLQQLMASEKVDIPTFRSNPTQATLSAAQAAGVALTDEELRDVSRVLVHPISIATWNLVDRSHDYLEVSGPKVAHPAFRYAIAMHTTMVILGLTLLGTSLGASLSGSAGLAAALGIIGIASISAMFFIDPIQNLYRSLGTRIQLEVITIGHQRQMDLLRMYARKAEHGDYFLVDQAVVPVIGSITQRTLLLIEHVGQPGPTPRQQVSIPGPLPLPFLIPPAKGAGSGVGPKVPAEKILMEPKMFVMDKPPMTEAPPTLVGDTDEDVVEAPPQTVDENAETRKGDYD